MNLPHQDFSLQTSIPFAGEPAEKVENGYEWLTKDGVMYYRLANSQSEWTPYNVIRLVSKCLQKSRQDIS